MSETLMDKTKPVMNFTEKVSVIEKDFKLNSNDRCDRCPSQAYVQVQLINKGELLFCAHHYKAQSINLLPLASVLKVRDESAQLLWKPTFTE